MNQTKQQPNLLNALGDFLPIYQLASQDIDRGLYKDLEQSDKAPWADLFPYSRYWHLATPATKRLIKLPESERTDLILTRIQRSLSQQVRKSAQKRLDLVAKHLTLANEAPVAESFTVTLEWSRGGAYGMQAKGSARVTCLCEYPKVESFEGSFTGGCGYDKASTAFADALNQSHSFRKELFKMELKRMLCAPIPERRDFIGYGSGYGVLPYLEDGVGVGCFFEIFERLGFKMREVISGKNFTVYLIERKG